MYKYGEAQFRYKADTDPRLARSEVGWCATGQGGLLAPLPQPLLLGSALTGNSPQWTDCFTVPDSKGWPQERPSENIAMALLWSPCRGKIESLDHQASAASTRPCNSTPALVALPPLYLYVKTLGCQRRDDSWPQNSPLQCLWEPQAPPSSWDVKTPQGSGCQNSVSRVRPTF